MHLIFPSLVKLMTHTTSLRQGTKPLLINGYTLSLAAVNAAARCGTPVLLDSSSEIKARVKRSNTTLDNKLRDNKSIYGVSTGYGGSGELSSSSPQTALIFIVEADTRTNSHMVLGASLFQHQHVGVLSTHHDPSVLPLNDPLATTSMPEAYVRAAMAIRVNSLIRGHSAVRWELLESLTALLNNNITPLVPLRGSISASGDLAPLSYVAGVMTGNPAIRAYCGKGTHRKMVSAPFALEESGLQPLPLAPKEHLGLLNGTAFSAGVAALALSEAAFLALLTQVCTAMGTEALLGTRASFHPFHS
jgi:phenylalanine ammonia-lyase